MRMSIMSVALIVGAAAAGGGTAAAQSDVRRSPQAETLAQDFRGSITYRGNWAGRVTKPGRPMRRMDARSMGRAMPSTRDYSGTITIIMSFNGNSVKARYSGSGGLTSGSLTGTRNGQRCRLVDDKSGAVTEATCGRSSYTSSTTTRPGWTPQMTSTVDATTTQFVDAVQEEARQQAAMGAARAAAEQRAEEARRQSAEQAALLAKSPRAGSAQVSQIARAVADDATNWNMNRLDAGSISDVRIVKRSGNSSVLHARYTYNGGVAGWVMAHFNGGAISCLEFHDMGFCAPPRPVLTGDEEARREARAYESEREYLRKRNSTSTWCQIGIQDSC